MVVVVVELAATREIVETSAAQRKLLVCMVGDVGFLLSDDYLI